jgi:hypothetical protein
LVAVQWGTFGRKPVRFFLQSFDAMQIRWSGQRLHHIPLDLPDLLHYQRKETYVGIVDGFFEGLAKVLEFDAPSRNCVLYFLNVWERGC